MPKKPHCPSCTCDPTSATALAYSSRIPGIEIPKDSRMFCLVTAAKALTDVMTWWRQFRDRDNGKARPATLVLDLTALRDGIAIEIREPPPPPRRYHPRDRGETTP